MDLKLITYANKYITSSLDKNYITMGIFIDLKKVFDTVDHGYCLRNLISIVCATCQVTF